MLQRVHPTRLDQITASLDELLPRLRANAVTRDRAGGHAAAEKELLRAQGLLLLSIPEERGGVGADWPTILAIVRRIATVDSSLAHLLAFQHLQLSGVLAYGSAEQQDRWLGETVRDQLWWGNAANPADPRLRAAETGGGLLLNGVKGFCSGTRGSQRLLTTAIFEPTGQMLMAVLPTETPGISIHDDWDPVASARPTAPLSVSTTFTSLGAMCCTSPVRRRRRSSACVACWHS